MHIRHRCCVERQRLIERCGTSKHALHTTLIGIKSVNQSCDFDWNQSCDFDWNQICQSKL